MEAKSWNLSKTEILSGTIIERSADEGSQASSLVGHRTGRKEGTIMRLWHVLQWRWGCNWAHLLLCYTTLDNKGGHLNLGSIISFCLRHDTIKIRQLKLGCQPVKLSVRAQWNTLPRCSSNSPFHGSQFSAYAGFILLLSSNGSVADLGEKWFAKGPFSCSVILGSFSSCYAR